MKVTKLQSIAVMLNMPLRACVVVIRRARALQNRRLFGRKYR